MRIVGYSLLLTVLAVSSTNAHAEPSAITVKPVAGYHKAENYAALLHHGGLLWAGRDEKGGGWNPTVELYDGEKLVDSIKIPHAVLYLYPHGPNQVTVTGKNLNADGWDTYYTTITRKKGKLSASTYRFGRAYAIEEGGGDSRQLFFTRNPEIVTFGSFGARTMAPNISNPKYLTRVGNALFALEAGASKLGDENIVKIDLKTESASRTFAKPHGIGAIIASPSGGHIVATAPAAGELLFIDTGSNRLGQTVKIPAGNPHALATLGRCVVVGSSSPGKNVLTFVDANSPQRSIVDEWELSAAGDQFRAISVIAPDPATGRVYVRSRLPCFQCAVSYNQLYVAEQKSGDTFRRCVE